MIAALVVSGFCFGLLMWGAVAVAFWIDRAGRREPPETRDGLPAEPSRPPL